MSSLGHSQKVTVELKRQGLQPPIFITSTLSDPQWLILEMDHEKNDEGGFRFFRDFNVVEGGEYHYKFRMGSNQDDAWCLDEGIPTSFDGQHENNTIFVKSASPPYIPPSRPSPAVSSISEPFCEAEHGDTPHKQISRLRIPRLSSSPMRGSDGSILKPVRSPSATWGVEPCLIDEDVAGLDKQQVALTPSKQEVVMPGPEVAQRKEEDDASSGASQMTTTPKDEVEESNQNSDEAPKTRGNPGSGVGDVVNAMADRRISSAARRTSSLGIFTAIGGAGLVIAVILGWIYARA